MLTRRFASILLLLLVCSLAVGYQVVWGQVALGALPSTVVRNPHGGFGPGTQQCMTCHSLHGGRQSLSNNALCEQCHAMPTHLQQNCVDCHDPHAQTDNLALIRQVVNGQPVVFHQAAGEGSLSEGADDPDALCVVCHIETRFHRHGAPETHFESQDCTRCHQHQYGFWPEDIQCRDCHTSVPLPSGDHTAHALAPYGPRSDRCSMCHPKITTWRAHRDGKIEFADRKRFEETEACDACHGLGGSEAKVLWGSGQRLDCLSCHNAERPAQVNGATAPSIGGFWVTSGHGNTTGFASGNPGASLSCDACHDPNAPHIGASDSNKRLRAESNVLCLSCHGAGGTASVKVSTHGNTRFGFRFQGQFEIDCTGCHDPHGSSNLAMIRAEIGGNAVVFTAQTGAGSFDTPNNDNRNDLCATCHTQTRHNRVPSNQAEVRHFEGADCTTCHEHNRDDDPATVDGFVLGDIGCIFCHGQPPPPASSGYPLDESNTPHQIHAGSSGYGFGCERCHDVGNSNYAGHRTAPPSFQDVWFDSFNPDGQYDSAVRTCGGLYCHSNGDPAGDAPIEYRPVVWAENGGLNCDACHGDATSQTTNAHRKHLSALYRERGESSISTGLNASIGCYECHSMTAVNDDNYAIANRSNHVDRVKQVAIDESDLWGDAGAATFDSASLRCANSRCHSDGVASRTAPGEPTYTSPVWIEPATGQCGTCHGITQETLTTGIHSKHLIFASCTTCHMGYGPTHVNGQVDFADGNTLGSTTVCTQCHGSRSSAPSQQVASEVLDRPVPTVATMPPAEATASEVLLPTPTAAPTESPTPTPLPTATPTATAVPTAVPTPTPTPALVPTATASPAPEPVLTPILAPIPRPSVVPTEPSVPLPTAPVP